MGFNSGFKALSVFTLLVTLDQSEIKLNSLLVKHLSIHISTYLSQKFRDISQRHVQGKISSTILPFNLVEHTVSNLNVLKS